MNKKNMGRSLVKTAIAIKTGVGLLSIKIKVIIGLSVIALFIISALIIGIIASLQGAISEDDSSGSGDGAIVSTGQAQVTADVERYRDDVLNELKKYKYPELIDVILAQMMQESGGRGNDPMQASESKCGSIGCINNTSESIEQGVKYFISVYEKANKDIKLTLQSYNFGIGFIDYAMKNGGGYSKKVAISFSQMMYQKLAHTGIYKCHRPEAFEHNACYGDISYVDAIYKYLPSASESNESNESNSVNGDYKSPLNKELRVTSGFGMRDLGFGPEMHLGIDLSCRNTDTIHAAKDGEIMISGVYSGALSYGNFVTIKHSETLYSTYAHLSKVKTKVGKKVKAGEVIGNCGSTGRSFGEHLHFEIKNGMWSGHMNPSEKLGI